MRTLGGSSHLSFSGSSACLCLYSKSPKDWLVGLLPFMGCINGLQMGGYSPKLWDLSGRPDFLSCKWGLLGVNDTPERRLKAQPCPVVQSSKHADFLSFFFWVGPETLTICWKWEWCLGTPQNVCSVF